MNKTNGTFWSTPNDVDKSSTYIYWQQAHAMDVLIYAYERHKDDDSGLASKYYLYMRRWYNNHANNYSSGSTGFENPYTDDMCWIGLTLMHMTEATSTDTYANTARTLFNNTIMKRAVEDEKGLWLPWNNSAGTGPNACTVGPACLLAAKLYLKYGDEKYLTYAEKFYTFMQNNICKSDGRVEEPPFTYTQGVFGEACRQLYHITGNAVYKNKATLYINYAFTANNCTSNGLLRDEGSSMDQSIFKAVLIPYAVNFCLDEDMTLSYRRDLTSLLQNNADALWKNLDKDSYPDMYCPYYWGETYDSSKTASMGAMVSGASLMENVARLSIEFSRNDGLASDGSKENPMSVAEVLAAEMSGDLVWVKAYIVGNINGSKMENIQFVAENASALNLALADAQNERNVSNCIPLQLPTGEIRDALNLRDNPGNLGKELLIQARLMKYFSQNGLKEPIAYELSGEGVVHSEDDYEAALTDSQGAWTFENRILPDGLSSIWTHGSSFGMRASGYANNTYYYTDSYLVSPTLVLSSGSVLTFEHVQRYSTKDPSKQLSLWIRLEGSTSWANQLTIPYYSNGTNWTFISSGEIDLSAYAGKSIQLGFRYISDEQYAATWEIKNVKVTNAKEKNSNVKIITAHSYTRNYGDVNPNFDYSVGGGEIRWNTRNYL